MAAIVVPPIISGWEDLPDLWPPPPLRGYTPPPPRPPTPQTVGAALGVMPGVGASTSTPPPVTREAGREAETEALDKLVGATITKDKTKPETPAEAKKKADQQAARAKTTDPYHIGGVKAVEITGPDGKPRIVYASPPEAAALAAQGAKPANYEDALARTRGKATAGEAERRGVDLAVGPGGAFYSQPGSTAVPPVIDRRPVAQRIRALPEAPRPKTLSVGGRPVTENWSFSGGYAETGTPGPREGYRRRSAAESAADWRQWTERRAGAEEARELRDLQMELARSEARSQIATRQAYAADPFMRERLEAQGRYAPELIKAESERARINQAVMAIGVYEEQIGKLQSEIEALSRATPADEQAEVQRQRQIEAAQQEIRRLGVVRAQVASVLLGEAPRYPQEDAMSMFLGSTMGSAPRTPTPER